MLTPSCTVCPDGERYPRPVAGEATLVSSIPDLTLGHDGGYLRVVAGGADPAMSSKHVRQPVTPHPDEEISPASSRGKGPRSVHDIPDVSQVFRSWRGDLLAVAILTIGLAALAIGGIILIVSWIGR